MFPTLPKRVACSIRVGLKTPPGAVPIEDARKRLLAFSGGTEAVKTIILTAVHATLGVAWKERLERARTFKPLTNRKNRQNYIRGQIMASREALGRLRERLNPKDGASKADMKERSRLERRIRQEEATIARFERRLTGSSRHVAGETVNFSTNWGTLEEIFDKLPVAPGAAGYVGGGYTVSVLSEAQLDQITINPELAPTPGDQSGQAALTLNTLWRLVEFGSGKFAKPRPRLIGKTKLQDTPELTERGLTTQRYPGAWWLGDPTRAAILVIGQRAGNVLRTQQMALYGGEDDKYFSMIKQLIDAYFRGGILAVVKYGAQYTRGG